MARAAGATFELARPHESPLALLGLAAPAFALWLYFRLETGIVLEDAWITYRYAENLASGAGFVFNPGERVLGTTTPLLTLLLAACGAVFGVASIPAASNALMFAAALATLVCLSDVAERATGSRAAALAVAALWAVHPDTLWTTAGGMETPLVVLWMVAGLALALRERWKLAAAASAALCVTRPDGVVWAGVLLALALVRLGRRALAPIFVGAAVLAPWLVFAWLYFGSPLPHSVVAKQAMGGAQPGLWYLAWLFDSLGFGYRGDPSPVETGLWLGCVALGAAVVWSRPGVPVALRAPAVFPPLFVGFLALGRAPWFDWYLVPATWCGLLLGVVGAREGARLLAAHARASGWPRASVPALAAGFLLLLGAGLVQRDLDAVSYWRRFQENEDETRRRVADWIASNTSPDAVVAMEAIGYQGALSRRRVIDLAGLVSPAVVELYRETGSNAATFAAVLERHRPDLIVLRSFEVQQNRHLHGGALFETETAQSEFLRLYAPALRTRAPHPELWGRNASITIWRRK
jgi:hypothetical protein